MNRARICRYCNTRHLSFLEFALRCLLNSFLRLFLTFSGSQLETSVYYNFQNVATYKAASFILQSCGNHLPSLNSAEGFQSASGVFLNFSRWIQMEFNLLCSSLSFIYKSSVFRFYNLQQSGFSVSKYPPSVRQKQFNIPF